MEYYSIVIFLLAIAIGISTFVHKTKIPYPILLLSVGIIVGFIPGIKSLPIDPDVVFLIFLPPLLYDAAYNMPIKEFKTNFKTISMMAISLVFITMTCIAIVAYFLIPGMNWPAAFVLGAILSPPDAAAAAGITKSLNLSHRTNTILEGESLINDASALTAYRITLSVALGGLFSFWDASLEFVISIVTGCLIGALMAYLFQLIIKKFYLESISRISLNLLLPFVTYLFAEELDVSGVLAVVVLGLMSANYSHKYQIYTDKERIQFKSLWDIITYLLSSLIFILIGIEFPKVLKGIPTIALIPLLITSVAIFLIAMASRIFIIFRHKMILDKRIKQYTLKKEKSDKKKQNKIQITISNQFRQITVLQPLSWKEAFIIGWSGMRGIVSLATAIALPLTLDNGESFTQRTNIIFLTVSVVILMLVIQGLGLPLIVKNLNLDSPNNQKDTVNKIPKTENIS